MGCLQVVHIFGKNLREYQHSKPYVWEGVEPDDCNNVMDQLAWRRSAIEFLPQLVARGADSWQYADVLSKLAGIAAGFDAWFGQQLQTGARHYQQPTPSRVESIDAIPRPHWWWRLAPP